MHQVLKLQNKVIAPTYGRQTVVYVIWVLFGVQGVEANEFATMSKELYNRIAAHTTNVQNIASTCAPNLVGSFVSASEIPSSQTSHWFRLCLVLLANNSSIIAIAQYLFIVVEY